MFWNGEWWYWKFFVSLQPNIKIGLIRARSFRISLQSATLKKIHEYEGCQLTLDTEVWALVVFNNVDSSCRLKGLLYHHVPLFF